MTDVIKPVFDARLYVRSVSPEGEIEGYICIFGDPEHRDSYGTFFDRNKMPDMALEYLPQPLYMEHGMDPKVGKARIGKVLQAWADNVGIKFRGLLDKGYEYFDQIVQQINEGLLATSSGTAGHLAEFDESGRFVNWPLVDLSLTSSPSESRMPMVSLVRSKDGRMYAEFTQSVSIDKTEPTEDGPIGGGSAASDRERSDVAAIDKPKSNTRSKRSMLTLEQLGIPPGATIEEVIAALSEAIGPDAAKAMLASLSGGATDPALDPNADPNVPVPEMLSADAAERSKKKPAPAPVENADVAALRAELATMRKKIEAEPPAPKTPEVRTPAPRIDSMRDRRFDHLTASEMALGYQIAKSITKESGGDVARVLTEPYMRAMTYKNAQNMETGDKAANDFAVRSKFPFTRANEVMGVAQSGFGAEWAEDLPGTELWQKVRNDTVLYQSLLSKGMVEREIPQGYKAEMIPLEGADPTWYVASEATDVAAGAVNATPTFATSKAGTGQKELTVAKLSVAIPFSKESDEDTIIQMAPELMRKIQVTAPEQIEYILINGDTTASANTNINLIDGTPNNTTTKPSYRLLDGFLKLALVTNTANSRDGGTFDETDFTSTMALMPTELRVNRDKLLFIMDSATGLAAANIAAVKTRDAFQPSTLENGVLTRIYRVDVMESGFMALANTVGKISATPANNILGRLLLVRPDRWTVAWKRRLQITTDYNAYSDSYMMVAHMRFGLAYYDTEAAAVSYDLTVS